MTNPGAYHLPCRFRGLSSCVRRFPVSVLQGLPPGAFRFRPLKIPSPSSGTLSDLSQIRPLLPAGRNRSLRFSDTLAMNWTVSALVELIHRRSPCSGHLFSSLRITERNMKIFKILQPFLGSPLLQSDTRVFQKSRWLSHIFFPDSQSPDDHSRASVFRRSVPFNTRNIGKSSGPVRC